MSRLLRTTETGRAGASTPVPHATNLLMYAMYYRVTNLFFDAGRRDEFLAHADTLRREMKAINGPEAVHICEVGEDQLVGIARYSSEESTTAAQSQVQSLMGQLADFVTGPPETKLGDVIWAM